MKKVNKHHRDYRRYEAIKYDLEHGVKLSKHKIEEYNKLKEIFE